MLVNEKDYPEGGGVLPVGTYSAKIIDLEKKRGQKGNWYYNVQFQIQGGEYDERIVFDIFTIVDSMRWKFAQLFRALGILDREIDCDDEEEMTRSIMRGRVDIETNIEKQAGYPDKTRVKRIKACANIGPEECPMPPPDPTEPLEPVKPKRFGTDNEPPPIEEQDLPF